MHLDIVTPEVTLFSGEVKSVTLPGTLGSFQILENHAPLISTLDAGNIRIKKENGSEEIFAVQSGFAEVLNNKVTVLV
jgi:F-type H+-transporting ATPase subunit epsilon